MGDNAVMARPRKSKNITPKKIALPRAKLDPPIEARELYIGGWIELMRKSQAEVAATADVNEGYLSQLISGKGDPNPTLKTLEKIAGAIGVRVGALFVPPPSRKDADAIGYLLEAPRRS